MNYGAQPFPPVISPPTSSHFIINSNPPPPPSYPSHVFPAHPFLPPSNNNVQPFPRPVFTPPPPAAAPGQLISWAGKYLPPPPQLTMPPLYPVQPISSGIPYNNPVFGHPPTNSPPPLHLNVVHPEPQNRQLIGKVERNDDNWESVFRRAASRNGIKVEESPKRGD